MADQNSKKKAVAQAAAKLIDDNMTVGVGTGSTVNYFIEALANIKHLINGAVPSSKATLSLLKKASIPVIMPDTAPTVDIYIDGADEATKHKALIKGGGAALTGEKIVAEMSNQFVCIIDDTKLVDVLGDFPLPIEVIPAARSLVARNIVALGGDPQYREGVVTDYGNIILDVYNLSLTDPQAMETKLNQIVGVVTNGLFAIKKPNKLLIANDNEVITK